MKITKDNLKEIKKINDKININYLESLYIDIQDYHDDYEEYSPERLDPCPDYYGMFSLRFENDNYMIGDFIGRLDELDTILFTLVEFFNHR